MNNVECTRCGRRWYAEKYEHGALPDECPYCYRDTVQPIPDPPTILDRVLDRSSTVLHNIPQRIDDYQHRLILWRENHRALLEIAAFAAGMLLIFSLLYVFLFIWQ